MSTPLGQAQIERGCCNIATFVPSQPRSRLYARSSMVSERGLINGTWRVRAPDCLRSPGNMRIELPSSALTVGDHRHWS